MTVTRLVLISHAATEAQRRAAFAVEEPILGIRDICWEAPARVSAWSSPERRTRQTAELLGLSAAVAEELRECDYGRWRGLSLEEVQSKDPEGVLAWLTDPAAAPHGGESIQSLITRVGLWMDEQCMGKDTVVVTHPSVVRAAIVHALQIPAQTFWRFDIPPLTFTDLRFNRTWTMRCMGFVLSSS
jgi:broad specificity phosphatase PhoE